MKFYLAKVVKRDGTWSNPITLFAEFDEQARELIASSRFGNAHEVIHVAI